MALYYGSLYCHLKNNKKMVHLISPVECSISCYYSIKKLHLQSQKYSTFIYNFLKFKIGKEKLFSVMQVFFQMGSSNSVPQKQFPNGLTNETCNAVL